MPLVTPKVGKKLSINPQKHFQLGLYKQFNVSPPGTCALLAAPSVYPRARLVFLAKMAVQGKFTLLWGLFLALDFNDTKVANK